MSNFAWRVFVIAGGGAVFAAFAFLYAWQPHLYKIVLLGWGVHPYDFPFLDTHAVLAAIECQRLGFDVYIEDPCDVFHRLHVYSPLFLEAKSLPVTTAWTPWVGVPLAFLYIVSVASLPAPRGFRAILTMSRRLQRT